MAKLSLTFILSIVVISTSLSQEYASLEEALRYFEIADSLRGSGNYDSSLYHFRKLTPYYKEQQHWPKYVRCLNKTATNLWLMRRLDESIEVSQLNIDESLKYLGDKNIETLFAYGNMGICYIYKRDHDQAEEFLLMAAKVAEDGKIKAGEETASIYNNLGLVYFRRRSWDNAINYYKKAIDVRVAYSGKNTLSNASSYSNIGGVYWSIKDFPNALKYFKISSGIRQSELGKDHPDVAYDENNFGFLYADMGEPEKGLKHLLRAVEIRSKSLGKKHTLLSNSLYRVGEVYADLENYDKALEYFQKAMVSNVIGFEEESIMVNPPIVDYVSGHSLLISLQKKSQAFVDRYRQKNDTSDLLLALSTTLSADTLIDESRNIHLRDRDKRLIGIEATKAYAVGIACTFELFKITKKQEYLDFAFYFSEKSRAATLAKSLANSKAKTLAKLPEEIITFESDLRKKQSSIRSQYYAQRSKSNYDSSSVLETQIKLTAVNSSIDSLILTIETNYPLYYNLKYQNNILSRETIQGKLKSDQAIIEYYHDYSTLYTLVIQKNNSQILSTPLDSVLDQTAKLKANLSLESALQEDSDIFTNLAKHSNYLYKKLLNPVLDTLPKTVNRLIFSTSGEIAGIPFELLISDISDNPSDFSSLPYLIKNYSVSYTNSASILFQDYESRENNKSLLSMAPSYDATGDLESYSSIRSEFRDKILPLKWNTQEIEEIKKYFDGDNFTNLNASEEQFKKNVSDYQIIHLAMHAFVDHNDPMLSHLVFANDSSSSEDGLLYVHELLNLNLSAEMAVLSACNTGVGKVDQGEGAMSLGTAFSYAGCPSIVASHWAVDDNSTSKLMSAFYNNLAQGLAKDVALKEAKLEVLKNGDKITSHPIFWAGFVVVGDTSPLQSDNYMIWILLAVGLVIVIGLVMLMRKKSR
ncbi:MAG: CHAT domain-containing protein [bacterium]|nr:CHAT domain-containing protein [bacterium]